MDDATIENGYLNNYGGARKRALVFHSILFSYKKITKM